MQSYERAVEYFWASASQGDSAAAYELGVIYRDGLGVDTNVQESEFWFSKWAAECGAGLKVHPTEIFGVDCKEPSPTLA